MAELPGIQPAEGQGPLHEALKRYFGWEVFRPGQEPVVSCLLEGRDCLAVLPTGGGKSLCYQLPALVREGLVLVISPLVALMQDQVSHLERRGIPAACLHRGLDPGSRRQLLEKTSLTRASWSPWRLMRPIASAPGATISVPTTGGSASCGSSAPGFLLWPSAPPPLLGSGPTSSACCSCGAP